jgi:hypothetical protein
MKRKRKKLIAALMAIFMVLSVVTALEASEASYWDSFKTLFIDWEEDAEPGSAQTATVGVRGVEKVKLIGKDGYDWEAVWAMEDFLVTMDDEKAFLKEGGLGPYKK